LDEQAFRDKFRRTPLLRPKRIGLLRNAALVLGNQRCIEAENSLCILLKDPAETLRWSATVALINIGTATALSAIREALIAERAPGLQASMQQLLDSIAPPRTENS